MGGRRNIDALVKDAPRFFPGVFDRLARLSRESDDATAGLTIPRPDVEYVRQQELLRRLGRDVLDLQPPGMLLRIPEADKPKLLKQLRGSFPKDRFGVDASTLKVLEDDSLMYALALAAKNRDPRHS
jgi:hypothetical protein